LVYEQRDYLYFKVYIKLEHSYNTSVKICVKNTLLYIV